MLFERTMSLEQFLAIQKKKGSILISGDSAASSAVRHRLQPERTINLAHREIYTSWSSTCADIVDKIAISCDNQSIVEISSSAELEECLNDLISDSIDVFIDISSMGVRLLSIVLANMMYTYERKDKPLHVYCGYGEPKGYIRRGIQLDRRTNKPAQFALYNAFAPPGPLPDFASVGSDEKPQLWVVLLGFEGYRTKAIVDDLSRIDDVIALVTVPSIQLGWSNHAISENSHFLRGVDQKMPSIKYVTASSPFAVYNFLCELQERYSDYRLQISPFSTKANSLGVLLYALYNPDCLIVFDNPMESSRPIEERSDIYHVYEITEALANALSIYQNLDKRF